MRKSPATPKGLFERTVAEAVGAVAAPEVRDRILGLALAWSHLPAVPERGKDVAVFVEGPLARAVEHALGPSAAASILSELAPTVTALGDDEISSVRQSWPELAIDRTTEPRTQPAPDELPVVLIASSDPNAVAELNLALSGTAYTEPVADAVSLLEGLPRARLVIVDCGSPTVRAETLVALGPELPGNTRVVVWGEPPALEQQLEALPEGIPASFVFCGKSATADDVAVICRVLLE